MVSRMFWCSAVRAGRKGSECLSQSESSTPERLCTALSRMSKMKVENEKAKQCYAQRGSKVSEWKGKFSKMRSVVRWTRAEMVSRMSKMKIESWKLKVENWKLKIESWKLKVGNEKHETLCSTAIQSVGVTVQNRLEAEKSLSGLTVHAVHDCP